MSEPTPSAEPFVVHLDRDTVVAKRVAARRANRVALGVSVVAGLVLLVGSVVALASAAGGGVPWVVGVIPGVLGLAFLGLSVAQALVLKRATRWYEATDLPDELITMTPDGIRLASEGVAEPIRLPWDAVAGFRHGRSSNQPVLTLLLTPGVTPATPGVSGLDQPEVVEAFSPRNNRRGIYYGVAALDQPVDAIDAAMRSFTGGRAGVVN